MPTGFGGSPGAALLGGVARGLNNADKRRRELMRQRILDRIRVSRLRNSQVRTKLALDREDRLREDARARRERLGAAADRAEASAARDAEEAEREDKIRDDLRTLMSDPAWQEARMAIASAEGDPQRMAALRSRLVSEDFSVEAVNDLVDTLAPAHDTFSSRADDELADLPDEVQDRIEDEGRALAEDQLRDEVQRVARVTGMRDPVEARQRALDSLIGRTTRSLEETQGQLTREQLLRANSMLERLNELRSEVSDEERQRESSAFELDETFDEASQLVDPTTEQRDSVMRLMQKRIRQGG